MIIKKIVAIGGGEIGRPGYPIETTLIDREIIKLSAKKTPKFLFIPTASSDAETYCDAVKKYFGYKLKCLVDVLYLVKERPTRKEIKNKILSSDIIYVGGGNTLKLMNIWRRFGIDKILKEAHNKGIVLCGLSAGANCWFEYSVSDSRRFTRGSKKLIRVAGLNFVHALCCPHYDIEKYREGSLKNMMKKIKGIAITLDNCCSIEVINNQYRIINSKKTANAYITYWKNGKYFKNKIEKHKKLQLLDKLFDK